MGNFLIWWLVNTISVFVVSEVLPGVEREEGILPLLLIALLIGVINAMLRPILYFVSCGLIIITLGLAIPVLNALLLLLADELAGDAFEIDGLLWAVIAAILMGIINSILNGIFKGEEEQKRNNADART
jgi:putative membrane protein